LASFDKRGPGAAPLAGFGVFPNISPLLAAVGGSKTCI